MCPLGILTDILAGERAESQKLFRMLEEIIKSNTIYIIIGRATVNDVSLYIILISAQSIHNITNRITIFKSMKNGHNPEDLSAEQFNQEVLNQLQLMMQTSQSQIHLVVELEDYLNSLNHSLNAEISELSVLSQKNEKVETELLELNRLLDLQRMEQAKLQRERNLEAIARQTAFKSAQEQLMKYKAKQAKQLKQLKFIDEQTQELISHTKLLENKLDTLNSHNKRLESESFRVQNQIKQMEDYIEDCYMMKKKLNNQLQELRGNIRVYCRIRPFLSGDDDEPIFELLNQNTLKIKVPKENHKSENHLKDYIFNFEQIFGMNQTQENIFDELGQLIQSAVDGKNVCIFAYGQTGSGKTYTMEGGQSSSTKGIIPRSIQLIFAEAKRAEKYNWQSEISVSIQEVYLESVKDLLIPKNGEEHEKQYRVTQPSHVYSLLEEARGNRKVAETNCNQHSSRSHLIFTIQISSRNSDKGHERKGSLNLVDLAGSQRVALSKVEGERMKETQAINKSLTNLGIVISSLAKKQSHIPFRNSKLTFLLQKYLEGDSKTLMFVNISPKQSDFNQTICSLRFAEKVKECKIKK